MENETLTWMNYIENSHLFHFRHEFSLPIEIIKGGKQNTEIMIRKNNMHTLAYTNVPRNIASRNFRKISTASSTPNKKLWVILLFVITVKIKTSYRIPLQIQKCKTLQLHAYQARTVFCNLPGKNIEKNECHKSLQSKILWHNESICNIKKHDHFH